MARKTKEQHVDEAMALSGTPEVASAWKRSKTDYVVELRASETDLPLLTGPRDVWLIGDPNRIIGRAAGFRMLDAGGRRVVACNVDFDNDAWANAWPDQPWTLRVMDYEVLGPTDRPILAEPVAGV